MFGLSSRGAARSFLGALGLPPEQSAAVNRAIGRATASSTIDLIADPGGSVTVRVTRPGTNGNQVMEAVVDPNGTKTVVHYAYDAEGNLVHVDPKAP